jgi:hypothetical protein
MSEEPDLAPQEEDHTLLLSYGPRCNVMVDFWPHDFATGAGIRHAAAGFAEAISCLHFDENLEPIDYEAQVAWTVGKIAAWCVAAGCTAEQASDKARIFRVHALACLEITPRKPQFRVVKMTAPAGRRQNGRGP